MDTREFSKLEFWDRYPDTAPFCKRYVIGEIEVDSNDNFSGALHSG